MIVTPSPYLCLRGGLRGTTTAGVPCMILGATNSDAHTCVCVAMGLGVNVAYTGQPQEVPRLSLRISLSDSHTTLRVIEALAFRLLDSGKHNWTGSHLLGGAAEITAEGVELHYGGRCFHLPASRLLESPSGDALEEWLYNQMNLDNPWGDQ